MEIVNVSEAGGVRTLLGQMERGVVLAWGLVQALPPVTLLGLRRSGHSSSRLSLCMVTAWTSSDWTLSSGASSRIWFRVNASAVGITFVRVPMEAWAQDTMASQPLLGLSYSSRCDVTCQLRSCTFFPPLCKICLSVNWKPPKGYVRDSDWFWEGL